MARRNWTSLVEATLIWMVWMVSLGLLGLIAWTR